jgi:predicted permease
MRTLLQDLSFGIRLLRRQPGFTLIAVLVLTVGIGVNTAAFSLVNTLMFKPRTGGVDHELAGLFSRHRERPNDYRMFSWDDYAQLRERRDLFRSLTAHGFGMVGVKEGDATRRVFADIVTANYFETFGTQPLIGRGFSTDEERPGADIPVVVISYGLWQRLGGSPEVVGTRIEINTRAFTIVGVVARGFGGQMIMVTPDVFVPTGVYESMAFDDRLAGRTVSLADPDYRQLIAVARLQPGASIESAAPALAVASARMAEDNPGANADYELQLAPLSRLGVSSQPQEDDQLTGVAAMLLSLSSVVLLIGSFNLANMLLARGQARRKEIAIRLAIGGSRWRLVRQLLTESVLLAFIGGAGGVLLAWWSTRFVFATLPPVLPITIAFDASPDARVLLAATAFSMLAAVFFGLGPAWKLARANTLPELKDNAGEIPAGGRLWLRWLTTRDALVMGQLALTFVMLTAAGLFVRGAFEAARSDPGFTLDRGVIVNVDSLLADYEPARAREYYRDALDVLSAVPGVEGAGFASHMPFGDIQIARDVQLPGAELRRGEPGAEGLVSATVASISSGYFDAIGVPVLSGRDFTPVEAFSGEGERIAIIDEVLARRLFGDENPIGRQVQTSDGDEPVLHRVVGVVGGVRPDLFSISPEPFLYSTFGQQFQSNIYLHARTSAPTSDAEAALLPSIGSALRALDPDMPFVSLETRPMFRERNLLLAIIRSGAWVLAMFGVAALFLAAVGVYGVKAYLVSRRTREIGIRIALGAEPRNVVGMVLREGLVLVAAGLVLGVALSFITGNLLRGMLFQGRALDLPVIGLAAATLLAAILLASWMPARRATRVAPTIALRAQ